MDPLFPLEVPGIRNHARMLQELEDKATREGK
jgi:hypothetical protein